MRKLSLATILLLVAGVSGATNAQANCKYDVVGTTIFTDPVGVFPDGRVTAGMDKWWEDDLFACHKTYLHPEFMVYFSACDFDGSGAVEFEEVFEIYQFVLKNKTGGYPAYEYVCPIIDDPTCPAEMPDYYDPATEHSEVNVDWIANGACAELLAESGSSDLACSQAQTNEFLNDINWILDNYDWANAVIDAKQGGHQSYKYNPGQLVCTTGEADPGPAGFWDDIAECWHGNNMVAGSMVIKFDWNVNYYEARDAYESYLQQSYPNGSCETDSLIGSPTGFHATDASNGYKAWTVLATEDCDYYGCRCEAELSLWSNGNDYYLNTVVSNNKTLDGTSCSDPRFYF